MKGKDQSATNLKIKVIENVVNDSNTTLERKR